MVFNSRTDVYLGKGFNNEVTVKSEADYTFNAGGSVVLGPGFTAEAGSNFTARAGISCSPSSTYRKSTGDDVSGYEGQAQRELFARMDAINLPEQIDLTNEQSIKDMAIIIFPNPAKDFINLYVGYIPADNLNITIFDAMGKEVYKNIFSTFRGADLEIPIIDIANGVYQVSLVSGDTRSYQKLVIQK